MTRRPRARKREVIVFTEGEATEVSYVDAIKHLQNGFVVRVDDRHGNPGFLVPLAIAEMHRLSRQRREEGVTPDEMPQVWCMFDRDQHSDVDSLIRKAQAENVNVAFSHPCFELWLLLHFRTYGAPSAGVCAGLVDAVDTHIAGYKKRGKRVGLPHVADRYEHAKKEALRLRDQHERDDVKLPTQRDPSTNVWEFVDALGVTY